MKHLVIIGLVLLLAACAETATETPVAPPVMETPAPPVVTPPTVVEVPAEEAEMVEEPEVEEVEEEEPAEEAQLPVFNRQTLAAFDGRDGRPAYVAVNGVVYDVTGSSRWRNGNHNGVQAGADLTQMFMNQHGDNRLSGFPVVGTYE